MGDDIQTHRRQMLCRIDDIPDGEARGFAPVGNKRRSIFVVRRGHHAFVYVNECPHAGAELEYARDRFLSADGLRIICFAHNAQFDVETGICVAGPCIGQALKAISANIIDGAIMIPTDHIGSIESGP
jgi:nitrite reductase/ring-hydroxylating ferredoxin subunit